MSTGTMKGSTDDIMSQLKKWIEIVKCSFEMRHTKKYYQKILQSDFMEMDSGMFGEHGQKINELLAEELWTGGSEDNASSEIIQKLNDLLLGISSYTVDFRDLRDGERDLLGRPLPRLYIGPFSEHGFIISPYSRSFCFGRNSFYQLGVNDKNDRYSPILHYSDPFFVTTKLLKVACGYRHSLFLLTPRNRNSQERVLSCGDSKFGQTCQGVFGEGNEVESPEEIDSTIFACYEVIDVFCGAYNSFFLAKIGRVFAGGFGGNGELGTGKHQNESSPLLVHISGIQSISPGYFHTIFLSFDGECYVTGSCNHGKMGISSSSLIPIELKFSKMVTKVDCGRDFSLFLLEGGDLYLTGKFADRKESSPVLYASNVKHFSAGEAHVLVEKSDRQIYSAGECHDGQLGSEETNSSRYELEQIGIFSGRNVTNFYASRRNSYVFIDDFELFACGHGKFGEMWDGSKNSSNQFQRVLPSCVYILESFIRRHFSPESTSYPIDADAIQGEISKVLEPVQLMSDKSDVIREWVSEWTNNNDLNFRFGFLFSEVDVEMERIERMEKTGILFGRRTEVKRVKFTEKKRRVEYFGELEEGIKHGMGKEFNVYTMKIVYFGQFRNGRRHGKGRLFKKDGKTIQREGIWIDGFVAYEKENISFRELNSTLQSEISVLNEKNKVLRKEVSDKAQEILELKHDIRQLKLKSAKHEEESSIINTKREVEQECQKLKDQLRSTHDENQKLKKARDDIKLKFLKLKDELSSVSDENISMKNSNEKIEIEKKKFENKLKSAKQKIIMLEDESVLLFERSLGGTRLHDYRILDVVSRGGSNAIVLRVMFLERVLAMKIAYSYSNSSVFQWKNIQNEFTKCVNSLPAHPNLLRLHYCSVGWLNPLKLTERKILIEGITHEFGNGGRPKNDKVRAAFFVMPLYLGTMLDYSDSKMSKKVFLRFIDDISKGLLLMKEHGIIHRDIKFDNLFYDGDGEERIFLIGDYGCCLHGVDDYEGFEATFDSNLPLGGSLTFMPPEVHPNRDHEKGDVIRFDKYDVYSLGIVCYFLLSGKDRKKAAECESFTLTNEECGNEDFRNLVKRMTDREYKNRFSVEELREVVEGFQC